MRKLIKFSWNLESLAIEHFLLGEPHCIYSLVFDVMLDLIHLLFTVNSRLNSICLLRYKRNKSTNPYREYNFVISRYVITEVLVSTITSEQINVRRNNKCH